MKLKQEIFLFFTVLLAISGVFLRFVQMKYAIDSATGYFISDSVSVVTLYFIIGIFAALILTAFFVLKKADLSFGFFSEEKNSIVLRISAYFVFAVFILYSTISVFYFFNNNLPISFSNFIDVLISLFFLVFITYIAFAVKLKNTYLKQFIYLAPLLLSLSRLISVFIKYTGIANISERVFEILTLASFSIFFIYYAKMNTSKANPKLMFLSGMLCVFVSTIYSISHIAGLVSVGNSSMLNLIAISSVVFDFSLTIYIFVILMPKTSLNKI